MQDWADPAVHRQLESLDGDLGAVGVVEPGGGDDRRQADAGVLVPDGLVEERDMVGQLPEGVADDVHGGGAGLRLLGCEKLRDEVGVGLVLGPGRPECFAKVVLIGRVTLV